MLRRGRSVLCVKQSPLVKTEGYTQQVFRWGVGNKFRSVNANRFTPVHHARPKEVTVREDYFESPDRAVKYDSVNEQWDVFWYENHKLNAKPFPVKKIGIEQSKQEALKFLIELQETGRFSDKPAIMESAADGVFWDDRLQSWISADSAKSVAFSASKHGPEKAKKLAEKTALKSDTTQLRNRLRQLVSHK